MNIKFRVAIDPTLGKLAIMARTGDSLPFNAPTEFPVAIFSSVASDVPFDVRKLAENIADLLNRRTPAHTLSAAGARIFYSRTDDGVALKLRAAGDQAGVAAPVLTMAVSSKSSASDIGHEMLGRMDADFMKRVCDAIVPDPEVSHHLQHNGRVRSNKPQQI